MAIPERCRAYEWERLTNQYRSSPKSDPYEEIYKADGVWWEMVKNELIDPARMIKKR